VCPRPPVARVTAEVDLAAEADLGRNRIASTELSAADMLPVSGTPFA
jgi:hypothetical protein